MLDASLFETRPPIRTMDLLGLIALSGWMGHHLISEEAEINAWVETLQRPLGPWIIDLLHRHLIDAANLSANCPRVTIHAGPSDWMNARLSLDDGVILLRTPLELLLENERSDWGFLLRLADRTQRDLLTAALARGALQIRQAGGITELTKSVNSLFTGTNETRMRRLRTWVMFDRDVDHRDERRPHADSDKAVDACKQICSGDPWPIKSVRLDRRSIENYLPISVLKNWAKTHHQKAAVESLDELRRVHPHIAGCVHMKEGLRKGLPSHMKNALSKAGCSSQEQRRQIEGAIVVGDWRTPFDQLRSALRADLLVGFGDSIADLYQTADAQFDADFAAEYNRTEQAQGGNAAALIESILERL